MNVKVFLKDKILTIILLMFGIASIEIFLIPYSFGNFIKIYIPLSLFGLYFISVFIEYVMKKRFYQNFSETLEQLEEKYLITEMIKEPDFLEGKLLKSYLEEIDKSMHERVNQYKYAMEDYKEYIELWIHEIKLPIATSKMIIQNNKNLVTKSIDEELRQSRKLY